MTNHYGPIRVLIKCLNSSATSGHIVNTLISIWVLIALADGCKVLINLFRLQNTEFWFAGTNYSNLTQENHQKGISTPECALC